jgi:AcrR family transcriptional regulator
MTAATRDALLDAGLRLAAVIGYDRVSRALAADEVGVHQSTVSYYWPDGIAAYHAGIMERAVAAGDIVVVAQGLVARHPAADAAPVELRRAAAAYLIGNET